MRIKNRFWAFIEKPFFFNQILKVELKIKKKNPRLALLVACSLIILVGIFWVGVLWSVVNFGVLFTHPPYPESQIPEECLYEFDYIAIFYPNGEYFYIPTHYNTVHNPTYAEMKEFLEEDKTDRNEYVFDQYVCRHFSRDLVWNATEKGIRAGYVSLRFPEQETCRAHAIVCFDTVDRGLIFIEPITDEEVRVVVGESYWQGIVGKNLWGKISNAWDRFANKKPSLVYNGTELIYDDTVQSVEAHWNGGAGGKPPEKIYREVSINDLYNSLCLERNAKGFPIIKSAYERQEVTLKIILSDYRVYDLNLRFDISISDERDVLIRGGGEEIEIPVIIYATVRDISEKELLRWDGILSEKSSKEISISGEVNFFGSYYYKDAKRTDFSKFTRGFFTIYIDKIDDIKVNYYR